jgi:hypothetical protein
MPDPGDSAAAALFDAQFYLQRNEDVAAAGADPLRHFIRNGRAEQRWPNRYFDPAWYRLANPDVAAAGADPLDHYIEHGEQEGRRPHPVFDPAWYRAAYQMPDGTLALAHFLANCRTGRVAPSPELFAVPLLPQYQDRGVDPYARYLDDQEASGQEPLPNIALIAASGLLDETYYLLNGPDVREAGQDPCEHYARYGWRERRRPNSYFDPAFYLATNPEAARLRIDPLAHYIVAGEADNRRPVPYFDPGWYRAEYRVPETQLALTHYLTNRRQQRFSPTPLFDVNWYIARFGAELGPNRDPFAHYLHAGMTRDIDPSHWFKAERYRRTHLGRPSRGFRKAMKPEQHNPLVHYLRLEYEQRQRSA